MSKATLMNAEVYEALIAANVPEDKAKAAAQSVAHYDSRLDAIERRLIALDSKVDSRFSLLSWMVGFNLVLTGGTLWAVVRLSGQGG